MGYRDEPRDLDSQLEDLLDQVWDSERRERMNDRIDAAVRLEEEQRSKRRRRRWLTSKSKKRRVPRSSTSTDDSSKDR